jgi:hypothetical protein
MNLTTIWWHGVKYSARILTLFPGTEKEEIATISIKSLGYELVDHICNGNPDAVELDDKITYYVFPEELILPEEEIRKIIENAV